MKFRENSGFTLIEVIVAINLSFFILTIAVSFYLFTSKFVNSYFDKIESKETAYNFINRIEQVLKNCDNFIIVYKEKGQIVFLNNYKNIKVGDEFQIGDLYSLDIINSFKFVLNTEAKQEYFIIKNENSYSGNLPEGVSFQ